MKFFGKYTCLIFIASFCYYTNIHAQFSIDEIKTNGTVTVVAGPYYQAGGLKRALLGKHYREEWTAQVEIPVLDLKNSGGGLRPHKRSGGFQSKSLSFKSANGGRFMFRSIDKDPSKLLPPELRETIIAKALRDGVSTSHPYGAVVVPTLASAAGIIHTSPKAVVLPDDPILGEHRRDFAGTLGIIEEFVINGPDGTPGFAGLTKVVSIFEFFEIREQSFLDQADQKAYLNARLLDFLLSDWDRHFDQWRWARFQRDGKNYWQPVPLDRDQAFCTFDGPITGLAEERQIIPQFEGVEKKRPDVRSLTWAGSHGDRIFFNQLTQEDFRQVAAEFVSNITDDVLERAVRNLPDEIYEISGQKLLNTLKSRRAILVETAERVYREFARYVEVLGRDLPEYVEITGADNDILEIDIYERDASTGGKRGEPVFHRVCDKADTREVRIYLLGGDDKVVFTGDGDNGIMLRIIGGPGEDTFSGRARGKTLVYDVAATTNRGEAGNIKFNGGRVDSVINAHFYREKTPSRDGLKIPFPFLSFSSEDALTFGAGLRLINYGFRKSPHQYKLTFFGRFSTGTSATRVSMNGEFVDAVAGLNLGLAIAYDPIDRTNFFGLGNDSERDAELDDDGFYRVNSERMLVQPTLYSTFGQKSRFSLGAAFKHSDTNLDPEGPRLIADEQPFGVRLVNNFVLSARLTIDTRDLAKYPMKGVYLDFGASFFPSVLDNDDTFTRARADFRTYLSPIRDLTFAFRAFGERVFGYFPYYEAAYLGSSTTLRAYENERFAGDASLLGAAEARFKLFRPFIVLPMDVGFYGFGEAGRVWLEGDSPGGWHTGYGGGLWLAPVYRRLAFSFGLAKSTETLRFVLYGGFAF